LPAARTDVRAAGGCHRRVPPGAPAFTRTHRALPPAVSRIGALPYRRPGCRRLSPRWTHRAPWRSPTPIGRCRRRHPNQRPTVSTAWPPGLTPAGLVPP